MNIYILRNGLNRQFISAYDTEASAIAERSNLLKVGVYRNITMETITVSSDEVSTLAAVKVEGYFISGKPRLTLTPYNIPEGVTNVDKLTFTVTSNLVSFVGYAKLTDAEVSATDVTALKARLVEWIENLFQERLINDNPEQVDPQPDPEPTGDDSGTDTEPTTGGNDDSPNTEPTTGEDSTDPTDEETP